MPPVQGAWEQLQNERLPNAFESLSRGEAVSERWDTSSWPPLTCLGVYPSARDPRTW